MQNLNTEDLGEILRAFPLGDKEFAIQMEDLSFHYITGEQLTSKWKKNEALGYINQFKFFEISEVINPR